MPERMLPFVLLPVLFYVIVIGFLLYIIYKWTTGYLINKQQQNEIRLQQNEILRDLVNKVDKVLDKVADKDHPVA